MTIVKISRFCEIVSISLLSPVQTVSRQLSEGTLACPGTFSRERERGEGEQSIKQKGETSLQNLKGPFFAFDSPIFAMLCELVL